jgi:hypothetical protein
MNYNSVRVKRCEVLCNSSHANKHVEVDLAQDYKID